MDKNEFINSIKQGALKGQKDYGILSSLTIAQAILESGWGSSELSQKANNLFGIKAFSSWNGKRITMSTTEWYNGQKTVVNADFRVYDSFNESIEDHNKLLTNQRYDEVRVCKDYKTACKSIYECGYATDPGYAEKLIKIIEQNKLYNLDNMGLDQEAAADLEGDKVQKFQHLCNVLNIRDFEGQPLKEDNKLGPRTQSCISKMPVLKRGSKGQTVEFVQEIVKAEPLDGSFGSITECCVKNYQTLKNIQVDGIVGPQTWSTIMSS